MVEFLHSAPFTWTMVSSSEMPRTLLSMLSRRTLMPTSTSRVRSLYAKRELTTWAWRWNTMKVRLSWWMIWRITSWRSCPWSIAPQEKSKELPWLSSDSSSCVCQHIFPEFMFRVSSLAQRVTKATLAEVKEANVLLYELHTSAKQGKATLTYRALGE